MLQLADTSGRLLQYDIRGKLFWRAVRPATPTSDERARICCAPLLRKSIAINLQPTLRHMCSSERERGGGDAAPRRATEKCNLVISCSASCKPEHDHQPTMSLSASRSSAPPLCASFGVILSPTHSFTNKPSFDADRRLIRVLPLFCALFPSLLLPPSSPGRFLKKRSLAKGTAPRSNSPHFRQPQPTAAHRRQKPLDSP